MKQSSVGEKKIVRWRIPPILGWLIALILLVMIVMQPNGRVSRQDIDDLLIRMDSIEAKLEARSQGISAQSGSDDGMAYARPGHGFVQNQGPESNSMPNSDEMRQAREGRHRELSEAFNMQGPAPASDPVPQQIIAAFDSENVLGALDVPDSKNVQCKAQWCMILAQFPSGADESDWVARMMLELGSALPSYSTASVRRPDGGLELRIYASRTR